MGSEMCIRDRYFIAPLMGYYFLYSKETIDKMHKDLSMYRAKAALAYYVGSSLSYVEISYLYAKISYSMSVSGNFNYSKKLINESKVYIEKLVENVDFLKKLVKRMNIKELDSFIKTYSEKITTYIEKYEELIECIENKDLDKGKRILSELTLIRDSISAISIRIT